MPFQPIEFRKARSGSVWRAVVVAVEHYYESIQLTREDGSPMTSATGPYNFFVDDYAFKVFYAQTPTMRREIVVLPHAIMWTPFFHGVRGDVVWRNFVIDDLYEQADLSTCTVTAPWPRLKNGQGIPASDFGANKPGDYFATKAALDKRNQSL